MINNNGYDYVDLGLPSGTLWATCNVGADKPSDYGLYFQWGDIEGYDKDEVGFEEEAKKGFTWKDYKFNPSGDGETFIKYTAICEVLNLNDDAAHVNMGGSWHMPRDWQIQELLDNTTKELAMLNDINGIKFFSKKDNTKFIFIPMAGFAWGHSIFKSGSRGDIWSSTGSAYNFHGAQVLEFNLEGITLWDYNYRDYGHSIRGVIG